MICCIFLWKIFFDILFLLIIKFFVVVDIFIVVGGGDVMDEFVFELDVDIVFFFFNWSCRDI